jgi:hypothetical protein
VDGEVMFNKAIYLIENGVGYTFTANFSKKTLKTIAVAVERIIDSLHTGGEDTD